MSIYFYGIKSKAVSLSGKKALPLCFNGKAIPGLSEQRRAVERAEDMNRVHAPDYVFDAEENGKPCVGGNVYECTCKFIGHVNDGRDRTKQGLNLVGFLSKVSGRWTIVNRQVSTQIIRPFVGGVYAEIQEVVDGHYMGKRIFLGESIQEAIAYCAQHPSAPLVGEYLTVEECNLVIKSLHEAAVEGTKGSIVIQRQQ